MPRAYLNDGAPRRLLAVECGGAPRGHRRRRSGSRSRRAVLAQARRREAQTTAERWRRWAQKPRRGARAWGEPQRRHRQARRGSHRALRRATGGARRARWPGGRALGGRHNMRGASARAGAAALAAVAEKRCRKHGRALHEWRWRCAPGRRRRGYKGLALLLHQHRASLARRLPALGRHVAQIACHVAQIASRTRRRTGGARRGGRGRAACVGAPPRTRRGARHSSDPRTRRAKAGDEAADRLRRSHEVARQGAARRGPCARGGGGAERAGWVGDGAFDLAQLPKSVERSATRSSTGRPGPCREKAALEARARSCDGQ